MFSGGGIYCDGLIFGLIADNVIYLKADDGLPYSELMKVIDIVREAGVEEVALISERKVQG